MHSLKALYAARLLHYSTQAVPVTRQLLLTNHIAKLATSTWFWFAKYFVLVKKQQTVPLPTSTYRLPYWVALTDDLIGFWTLKVKVIADRGGGEGIHVDAEASRYILWFMCMFVSLCALCCGLLLQRQSLV